MIVYHGSYSIIEKPDLSHSRTDIDFGAGFYLTEDKKMASKWVCNKANAVVNTYELDVRDLKIKEFALDEEWLKYVIKNRNEDYTISAFDDSEYDVLIGATVDDKMSRIVDLYYEGMISINRAIDEFNHMQYSRQIVLKTDAAINKLTYLD